MDALDREIPIVVPIAGLVQSGRHLAIGAYCAVVSSLVEQLAQERPDALFLPVLNLGAYEQHLSFPGTVAHSFETIEGALSGTVESLHRHGFRRFLFVTDIPENYEPVRLAARRLKARHPNLRLAFDVVEYFPGHAGSEATASVLAVAPELVREDMMQSDGLIDPLRDAINSMEEVSESGSIGHPQNYKSESAFDWGHRVDIVRKKLDQLAADDPLMGIEPPESSPL